MTLRPLPDSIAHTSLPGLVTVATPFWRNPNRTLVGVGAIERVVIPRNDPAAVADLASRLHDAGRHVAFCAAEFATTSTMTVLVPTAVVGRFGDAPPWWAGPDDVDIADLIQTSAESPPLPRSIDLTFDHPAQHWMKNVVAPGREHVRRGDLDKVVLARRIRLTADTDWPIRPIIESLSARFSNANVFHIDGFVGASPELLVGRQDRQVFAHPLAGTAPRDPDPQIDASHVAALRASAKDRHEHRITIDWLLTELLPFCSYVDAEPEPTTVTMQNVHHLGTRVEGMLSEPPTPILDLVDAVHPTPAVAGDPTRVAADLLRELEGVGRGRYAGPAGWFDVDGNGEFAVSVRTASIDGARAEVWAGVGVVGQSELEAELAETQAKFGAMLGTLLTLR